MSIATINPSTGETGKTFTPATDDEIDWQAPRHV
jgi:hypothetical protein